MTPFRTILYLVKRKRKYTKLVIPFLYFCLEMSVLTFITFYAVGFFNFENCIFYVRGIHPIQYLITHEFGKEVVEIISINPNLNQLTMFAFLITSIISFIGLIISILWMNRFFKYNTINIEWWQFLTGSILAHLIFLPLFF